MYIKRSFSLIELSVVIAVSAIILGTSTTGYLSYKQYSSRLESQAKLDNLKTAIENYFATNGYLPCPADPTLPFSSSNYGSERLDDTGTGCSGDSSHNSTTSLNTGDNYNYSNANGATGHPITFQNQSRPSTSTIGNYWLWGSVPTSALGLRPNDGIDSYGNKISYVVHDGLANYKRHSNSLYSNLIGFANFNLYQIGDTANNSGVPDTLYYNSATCALNNYIGLFGNKSLASTSQDSLRLSINTCNAKIMDSINTSATVGTLNNLAFVLITYGVSGKGAWNNSGTINPQSSNTMEQKNSYGNYATSAGAYNASNYVFDASGATSKGLIFYRGVTSPTFNNYVVSDTTSQLINNTNTANAVYCHPNSHPGKPASPISSSNATMTYTKNGQSYALGGINKQCSGAGTWL